MRLAAPFWRLGDPLELLHDCLDRGGVLGVPTGSSYALAADPSNTRGVATVSRIKGRERDMPLPVVVAGREQLDALGAELSDPVLAALAAAWPAPLSLLLPLRHSLPAAAGETRLAVRVPAHRPLQRLLRDLGRPLTATSANRTGEPPRLTPERTAELLAGYDGRVVDGGAVAGGAPSTMVAVDSGRLRILREGRFPAAEVARQAEAIRR